MVVDYNLIYKLILPCFAIFIYSVCGTFLLIILRPLYKFSKERTALFILFSKKTEIHHFCYVDNNCALECWKLSWNLFFSKFTGHVFPSKVVL
uniref:Uncharacterized protein n=1 Tax=Meloidogyne enterolobii TaxID=390850 RepID=A0A6V7XX39_MELEN|nr:unnamed protein product [Meloidogyne enterolobii]